MEIQPLLSLTTLVNLELALLPGKCAFKKPFRWSTHGAAYTSLIHSRVGPESKQQHHRISRSLKFNGSADPNQPSPPTILISNRWKCALATAFLNSVLCQQTVKINWRSCLLKLIVSVSKPRSRRVFEWCFKLFAEKKSILKMSFGKTSHWFNTFMVKGHLQYESILKASEKVHFKISLETNVPNKCQS